MGPSDTSLRPSGNCWGVEQEAGLTPQAEVIEMNGGPKLGTRPGCRLVGLGVSLGYVGLKAPTSPKKDLVTSRVPAHKLN